MKSKQAKLYISVFKQSVSEDKEDYKENKVTLLNASKISLLSEIIPDEETLITHMKIQRIKVEMDKNYSPVPFEICLESRIFTEINREIQKYDRLTNRNQIALFTSWPGVPICIISIRKN